MGVDSLPDQPENRLNPMTKILHLHVLLLLLATSQAWADCPPSDLTSHLAIESPVAQKSGPQVGHGEYSYRFVVRNPQDTMRPYRHGRYQIELKGTHIFPDGTHFYRGTTDALGRTATFHFSAEVLPEHWFVQPLVGQGELGESYHLTSDDCTERLDNRPYMLDAITGSLYCGRTLPDGYTARHMTTSPVHLQLHSSIWPEECNKLASRVNPVMALSSAPQKIKGLEQLLQDSRLKRYTELLQGKLDAVIIQNGSVEKVKALVKRRQAELNKDGGTPRQQSSLLNNMAYQLIDQSPPRHPAYADELLDASLALDENGANMDSKAWALHLLGRDEEALPWANRSVATYGKQCSAGTRANFVEALSHRGMILWSLKQRIEALNDWARADAATSAGGWTNAIPDWKRIKPLIKARAENLRQEGFVETVCQ